MVPKVVLDILRLQCKSASEDKCDIKKTYKTQYRLQGLLHGSFCRTRILGSFDKVRNLGFVPLNKLLHCLFASCGVIHEFGRESRVQHMPILFCEKGIPLLKCLWIEISTELEKLSQYIRSWPFFLLPFALYQAFHELKEL